MRTFLRATNNFPHPEEPARASSPGRRLEGRTDAAAAFLMQGFTMNVTASLCDLSAVELRRRIAGREISPVELLAACHARIDAVNPALNAVVAEDRPAALAAAEAADRKSTRLNSSHSCAYRMPSFA